MKIAAGLLMLPCLFIAAATSVNAAEPVFTEVPDVVLCGMSNNGRWAISSNTVEDADGNLNNAGGAVWDLNTVTSTAVKVPESGIAALGDITDDGLTIVGSCNDIPAYYDVPTATWHTLPMPPGATGGFLSAVTADRNRAVGYVNQRSIIEATPVLYDLKTGQIIDLPNLPTVDMNHDTTDYSVFRHISADGRYVLGGLSTIYLQPISMCYYIYDTKTDKVNYIGFTPRDKGAWTPDYENNLFIEYAEMSPSGLYVTGMAYMGKPQDNSEFLDEYQVAFKYDVLNDTFELYDGAYDADIAGVSITDEGLLLATSPAVNPYSYMEVRNGNYYYSLTDICEQVYGINLEKKYGINNTGKPAYISGDGKTLIMIDSPTSCYVMKMTDRWEDLTARVNLLNDYSASPADGSTFSVLSEITLTFNRNIEVGAAASQVKVFDSEGKQVQTALRTTLSDNKLTLGFRSTALAKGRSYTVRIPAGFVTMVGDLNVGSNEITLTYTGRGDDKVAVTRTQPADGAAFARLDAQTNYIAVEFDAPISVVPGAKAKLLRKGETEPVCNLEIVPGNTSAIALYPLLRQYLYDGTDYVVHIPAGSVTDLSGNGANEEILLNYKGTYVREVSADDKYIFRSTCDEYVSFMFYDGDRLTPSTTPSEWGFTAENPWIIVRADTESTDMAYAAHSMFTTSGTADDWCVTPQLYIPDTQCYLQFDAQSYLSNKADVLKVYVYASENSYSTLDADIVNDIRTKGQLVFNRRLSPGSSQEGLTDDWQNHVIYLNDYAGKNIYIAFVNDNKDQSAVFIDNVQVVHDMQFLTTLTGETTVVKAADVEVSGVVTVASDILKINSISLSLLDASSKVVSTVSESGLSLSNGQAYNFTFPDRLPLQADCENSYTVSVLVNGTESTSLRGKVKNLAFRPVQQFVIEEYSGRTCSNCPLGFVAMDNLERLFPGQIIPIVIRTYESDPLGTGLQSYTSFLGIDQLGAPSGMINRRWSGYPMVSVGTDYRFSGTGVSTDGVTEEVCWLDAVVSLMEEMPEAEIRGTAAYDGTTGKINIDSKIRFAINSTRNVNLLVVVLENQVTTAQLNGMYQSDDPDLGEWGAAGIYGKRTVSIKLDNVARGVFGATFNGYPGLVPTDKIAGRDISLDDLSITVPESVSDTDNMSVVVMMIDGDTDHIINAFHARVATDMNSIESVDATAGAEVAPVYYDLTGRRVPNPSKGSLLIRVQGSDVSKIIY